MIADGETASLCDTCHTPGRCCRQMHLNFPGDEANTPGLALLAETAQMWLPFAPLTRLADGTWRWWCPNLGDDGRCTDYEHRPETCRRYEPASDPLCVYYVAEVAE